MAEPITLVALVAEACIGWPDRVYRQIGHPVGSFAHWLAVAEQRWNSPAWPDQTRRVIGIATMIGLLAVTGTTAWAITWLLRMVLGIWAWPSIALLALPGLAQNSLHRHVAPIGEALQDHGLSTAQRLVGRIVGRDTARLDEAGITRAAIESLAESFCDGVVAPAFWLLLAGLPGLWMYKALNTADSLIGHRETRWRAFGWAAARGDDVANLLPARIAGCLLCIAGGGGWRTMIRYARHHASPNAGWPEAAMAGALGLRLAGPLSYDGVVQDKPWIGNGRVEAGASDLTRALAIYRLACVGLWLIAGALAWAL